MFKLLRFLKPYWLSSIILVLAIGAQTWGTLQLPALMANIVNDGISAGDMNIIYFIGIEMLGCAVLSAAAALLASYLSAKIGTALARDIRAAIFKQILSFSIPDIDKFSTASLITRTTNDVAQVQQTMILCLSMLLRVPLMAIGAIIQAIATAPAMTWIIALAVGILLLCVISIMVIVVPKFKIFQSLLDKITLLTRENLTGLRVVRAFNNQAYERRKFERANNEITKVNIFINNIMSLESPLMTLVFNGTTLLCIWVGISLLDQNLNYLGDMMAFMQYAIQVVLSFLFLTILFVLLPRANVSAARINEVLDTKPSISWNPKTKGEPENTPSVRFENVSFTYGHAAEKALRNISFEAKAGETVAIIGSTGSGKSTLLNLIPRFYDATSGKILIDGLEVKDYAKKDLMRRIGYVPQKSVLFAGSINSNITFGNPSANAKTVVDAASISQAKEFIEKLDDKYGSFISQGGTNVSGGQKQRLQIARAIAKNPEIYLFDDSFSALDMKTDAKLRKNLKTVTEKSVVLIVAQRISTIKDADQILVLDNGKIVGHGRHEELLVKNETYQEIARSQLSDKEYSAELKKAESTTSKITSKKSATKKEKR